MDVVKAVQGYITRVITEIPGIKCLLLDHYTVCELVLFDPSSIY